MTGPADLLPEAPELDTDLARVDTCIRCAHWGVQSDVRETDRWMFCMQGEVHAMAHRNYRCEHHERVSIEAARHRLEVSAATPATPWLVEPEAEAA
jgi:hypothetical protein